MIVNVGAAHLELLGSLEAIAAAKAELIAGMAPGGTAWCPFGEPLLDPHLRADLRPSASAEGADVTLAERRPDGAVVIRDARRASCACGPPSRRRTTCATCSPPWPPRGRSTTRPRARCVVEFSEMRGQRHALAGRGLLIEDCYNANPMSMLAALEDLAASAPARRVAVLGEMLELGDQAPALHREVGRQAGAAGVELLVAVGPLGGEIAAAFPGEAHTAPDAPAAAELLRGTAAPGDTVLVKGSRGVGLEVVCAALRDGRAGLQAHGAAAGPR